MGNQRLDHLLSKEIARKGKVKPHADILLFSQAPTSMGLLLFENRKLEIKENYNSYNEIDNPKGLSSARKNFLLSVYGRTTDALASVGYEGRGRLR